LKLWMCHSYKKQPALEEAEISKTLAF
jgi:hypothetical protein